MPVKQIVAPRQRGVQRLLAALQSRCEEMLRIQKMIKEGTVDTDARLSALKKAIKDLTVKRFPGTGHVIHGYRPEPFLEALEPFLRRVRAPEGATGP